MTASVVRMLEMKSIDVEGRLGGKEDGETCLMIAACNGHLDICRLLIDKGAQVTAKDDYGRTPLHYAAMRGHVEIARLFCNHGADVEARDRWGYRTLHLAANNGHISVVKELVEERNAEINARNGDGHAAMRVARLHNKPDVAAYLLSHGGI